LAALEATLALYRDPAAALEQVPTLRMIAAPPAELARRARRLARRIPGSEVMAGESSVGGGAFPEAKLETTLVAVRPDSCEAALEGLRRHSPPVIARAQDGRVVFDVRTIRDEEFPAVAEAVRAVRTG
ncbi:MAG: L-seryl-tRNA(Sec) selenium transferase, partial [Gemmatimonadetes bacterium]|nr:L-seryl-tRNA(Sec) selenium transferase [Gemmatimonadota bacterium]